MDVAVLLTIVSSVVITVITVVATHANSLRLARRKDRLDRLNQQLSDFYGPLFAYAHAGERAFHAFFEMHRPPGATSLGDPQPATEELEAFRLWMHEIFLPMNDKVLEIIVERAQLLDEDEMPAVLVDVCANAYAWRAVGRMWQNGDVTRHATSVPFPGLELRNYTSRVFAQLKHEQNRLLGSLRPHQRQSVADVRHAADELPEAGASAPSMSG